MFAVSVVCIVSADRVARGGLGTELGCKVNNHFEHYTQAIVPRSTRFYLMHTEKVRY